MPSLCLFAIVLFFPIHYYRFPEFRLLDTFMCLLLPSFLSSSHIAEQTFRVRHDDGGCDAVSCPGGHMETQHISSSLTGSRYIYKNCARVCMCAHRHPTYPGLRLPPVVKRASPWFLPVPVIFPLSLILFMKALLIFVLVVRSLSGCSFTDGSCPVVRDFSVSHI